VPNAPSQLQSALAGRYRIEHQIGRGGMATVWIAHDLKHDRQVAIKVIRPELSAALGSERFLREIRIAAKLQHPHILTLIDSGDAPDGESRNQGSLYYVMPYVEGETLRQRLTREGRFSQEETVHILRDILDALVYAHRHGIIHRDIKPENIMLTGRHALVMDFGVAKAITAGQDYEDGTLTGLGLAVGTPAYMSPEQAAGGGDIDPRTDIYAAGVVAYEMLTGQPPFTGTTPQSVLASQITRSPEPLSRLRPDLATDVVTAVMRCLEKDSDRRWQSAEELLGRLERSAEPGPRLSRATLLTSGALVVALAVGLWLGAGRRMQERRWAREEAIPRLLALGESGDWEAAYQLARRVAAVLPHDSLFNTLRPRFAIQATIRTVPSGALVWRKPYDAPESSWALLGRTPLDSTLLAFSGSPLFNSNRIRIEKPGYRTLNLIGLPFADSAMVLDREVALPAEMVRVAGGDLSVSYPGFEHVKPIHLGDYLMDRYEVTNRDFKRFVDSGGYAREELWEHPFLANGREIPWRRAIDRMKDRTGRQGPSTWEAGDYPAGQENYPVGGVSWYEAAAYARFSGKSLPTVVHWNNAAGVFNASSIIPRSNFFSQGSKPVGSGAISPFGTYDMGGNVREWCVNPEGTNRFVLGGGWTDQPYQFTDAYTQPPFDRSPANGIRLVTFLSRDSNLALAAQPLRRSQRDFLKERPVSDPVFSVYRRMYEYDRGPLDAKIVETVDLGDGIRQLVRMNAAYSGDSLLVYLFLPKRGSRPYPALILWPGSNIIRDRSRDPRPITSGFILKGGRALILPVFKGTYQRSDSLYTDTEDTTTFYRDHVIMWAKDIGRAIDYAETRSDLSTERLGYFGLSWGGAMGAIMPAVERRIKVSVLYVAGLSFARARPEVDPINFLPRITIPTLMLNGRYDFYFPMETSQIPMFRLLGSAPNQKRYVVENGSHFVPRARLIQETLAWLDKWQPVR
jgi:formylglycine-generating enzyme required for sulfatase activity/pimeloyl-ACP methyl ester carboxylesterase